MPPTFTPALQVLDVEVLYHKLYDFAPLTAVQLTIAALAEVAVAVKFPGVPQVVPPPPPDWVVKEVVASPDVVPEQEAATRTL